MDEKIVILMLSGGRDSFISACRLLDSDENYVVKMVTYDNGCSVHSYDASEVAKRIISKYGEERASYLGVYSVAGIMREFFFPYYNMKPEDQMKTFKGLTPSQFHCLICRTSMYIASIWLAWHEGAEYIAEGGRKDQEFVIELPGMAQERFYKLTESAGIHQLLPVYEMSNDWERDNELIQRGFVSKSLEPKCLIGCPVCGSIDDEVIEGVHAYYDEIILKQIEERGLLTQEASKRILNPNYNELKK